MSQSNIAVQDNNKTAVKTATNKELVNANNIKEPLKGDLLQDTSVLMTVFKGEVKNSKVKLDWFKSLTQANCFSNYKNLTSNIVKTGESDLIRVYYNYIKNLNTKIKNGSIKLPCLPFAGSFDLKAIDSTKDENNKTKVNNIDLNNLTITAFKQDSADSLADLGKQQKELDSKKQDTVIVHDDSQKASYNAVIGSIANLSPSDRLSVLDELLSKYDIILNVQQGKHKKAAFDLQVKAAKKDENENVTKLTK